jgi:hypothetical protein
LTATATNLTAATITINVIATTTIITTTTNLTTATATATTAEAARLAALAVANLLGRATPPPPVDAWGGGWDMVMRQCCGDDDGMQLGAKDKYGFLAKWREGQKKNCGSHKDQIVT